MRALDVLDSLLVTALLANVASAQNNVLLVIADDMGVDRVGAYAEHPDPGNTPVLDSLAAQGVLFRNAWSNPLCSPTRATILTGRYGFRTEIGVAILEELTWPGLSLDEFALPEVLLGAGYHCEVVGKWHVGSAAQGGLHPLETGFRHHRGSLFNLEDYFAWEKWVDGVPQAATTYATTDTVDDTIQLVQTLPEPWFIWMAFNAPHTPLHAPPDPLHSFSLAGDPRDTPVDHVKAAIEATDTELGRLLAFVDANTTIIFVGDNGTYRDATDAPFFRNHAKGTVYEGGVNVPLIIAGPPVAVPGSECAALVNTTDLFATIVDLARLGTGSQGSFHQARWSPYPRRPRDSVSLLPYLTEPTLPSVRETVYAEKFGPNGTPGPYDNHHRAMRGPRYKLIEKPRGDEFFDLLSDPFEQNDLLQSPLTPEQDEAYQELKEAMSALLAS